MQTLTEKIDAILPQTQCGQCGYDACYPYAEALAAGAAEINQCPPGGEAGIRQLARLLQKPVLPLNSEHGLHKPKMLALIDEENCIGCALCIKACPVDAILGAKNQMHSVIDWECTGCELCIAPCPTDCIRLVEARVRYNDSWLTLRQQNAAAVARARYQARKARLEKADLMAKNRRAAALLHLEATRKELGIGA